LAVAAEEMGVPIPIDAVIAFAGATVGRSVPQLTLLLVALTLASAVGASGMYAMMRYGGRPLVSRFGHYIHLGPKQLARAEALLARGGWGGIAIGRATPGIRYATVIACGLLRVPYLRFVTAHIAGTAVYTATLLALGAAFGPTVLNWIYLPTIEGRLIWLVLLAVALPLLMVWWARRTRSLQPTEPSRRRLVSAVLLGSFAGTAALAAFLFATSVIAELLGTAVPLLNAAYSLLGWSVLTFLSLYAALLVLLLGVAIVYYEVVLPHLASRSVPLFLQTLGLALLALSFFGTIFLSSMLVVRVRSLDPWWQAGEPIALVSVVPGVALYALTTVYARALAIAVLPTFRRNA